ncbi:unnamed protein product, partial [Laminaria digitata]
MNCFGVLYPTRQLGFEVDHSGGQAKYRADGFHVGDMSVEWGGANVGKMRTTTVTDECLGSKPTTT